MLIRVPDYYDAFHCLAGACPHSCCEKWEVVIDEESAERYKTVPGELGEKLRATMVTDCDGDICFALNGGRCPFLDAENLCEIHRQLGAEATSVTCREHPRFTEDYGSFREITLSVSCPAANALLLGSDAPLRFEERMTEETGETEDEWLAFLLPLRERMLELLQDRTRSLRMRMRDVLLLAAEAQYRLESDEAEALPTLAETWQPPAETPVDGDDRLFPLALQWLASLECLEEDWRRMLKQAENTDPAKIQETALERIAAYFAFRYLLKSVNDGDLLSHAQFVVLSVLVVERLAAVCGLPEALRRFSCEIEHSDDNLEALQEVLFREGTPVLSRFLAELAG